MEWLNRLKIKMGHLGGSVGWASDFGSGHDLTVCEFEPHIRICADHLLTSWSLLQILCLLPSLPLPRSHFVSLCFSKINKCKKMFFGAPGWCSRLSVRLQPGHDLAVRPWVRAPRRALGWWLRACSLFLILCLPLSLPLPRSCSVSLCPKNK